MFAFPSFTLTFNVYVFFVIGVAFLNVMAPLASILNDEASPIPDTIE